MVSLNLLQCYGNCTVSQTWKYDSIKGMNRLYFIHGGNGGYIFKGIYHKFNPRHIYFFPSTTEYSLYSDTENGINHTFADFELIPPIYLPNVTEFETKTSDVMLQKAIDVFIEGGNISCDRRTGEPELLKLCFSAMEYIVTYAVKISPQASVITDSAVISALETMQLHTDEPLTVESMAELNHLSTDCFIRRFKKCMGITPYSYFKNLRIRTAQYMIDGGKSLSEAAAAVGYSDTSALLHAMKKIEKR